MAYSNYGGRATRNGIRMTSHEDRAPFMEDDPESGSFSDPYRPKHVILGSGRFRLCGDKIHPELWIDGQEVSTDPYCTGPKGKRWRDGSGDIDGYHFAWSVVTGPDIVTLTLVEPDGTLWLGYSGFEIGAGWDDEEDYDDDGQEDDED